jgi:hypothetical protein
VDCRGRSAADPGQLAALPARTGAAAAGTLSAAAVELLGELGERSRWPLVFDNAEDPDALPPFLPGGPEHVLITSRNPHLHTHAVPLDVGTLSRAEAVALLRAQGAILTDADADVIGATLDDLPLALTQAAALSNRGLSAAELREELAANLVQVMSSGPSAQLSERAGRTGPPAPHRLETDHPGPAAVLNALALLAPEPFPPPPALATFPNQESPLLPLGLGWRHLVPRCRLTGDP